MTTQHQAVLMHPDRSAETSATDVATGVYYATASVVPGSDVSQLAIRLVMTLDVQSAQMTTRHVLGADAACDALRGWLNALCGAPTPFSGS